MKKLLLLVSCWILAWPCMANIEINEEASLDCICPGTESQAIILDAYGSAEPFSFLWAGPSGYSSTEQSPYDITEPGLYTVTVTNRFGCETVLSKLVETCSDLSPPQFQITPNCSSGGGNVTATVTGGDGGLSYEWSNEVGGKTISNVPAGTYTLTVTDDAGCSIIGEVVVPVPEEPLFEIDGGVTPDCNPNGGSITLDMEGITAPYQIQWSLPGATGAQLTGLNNGYYYVTVTDVNGCSNEAEFLVYGSPVYQYEVENASCNTISDGRIELIESSGGSAQPVTMRHHNSPTPSSNLPVKMVRVS